MFANNINYQFHSYTIISYTRQIPKLKLWIHSQSAGTPSNSMHSHPLLAIISRTLKKNKAEKAESSLLAKPGLVSRVV